MQFPAVFNVDNLNGKNGFTLISQSGSFGTRLAGIGDINDDGFPDLIVSALVVNKAFVVFGAPNFTPTFNASNLNGANGFTLISSSVGFGQSVAGIGDVNGDGKLDFMIGAYISNKAFVIFGASHFPSIFDTSRLDGNNGFMLVGPLSSDFGVSVAGVGDINGDDKPDFIVGAYLMSKAFVVFGVAHFPSIFDVSNLNGNNGFIITSSSPELGFSTAGIGNINGDGFPDLIIGAPQVNKAFVIFGTNHFPAVLDISSLSGNNGFTLVASNVSSGQFGFSVSGIGDINGDGRSDFLIGASEDKNINPANRAFVIFGANNFPVTLDVANLNGQDGFILTSSSDTFGYSVGGFGDINGDNKPDFGIGAWAANKSFVVFGSDNFSRYFDTANLNGINGFALTSSSGDYFGTSIAGVGNLNGNERSDFIVGSWNARAYVIFGQTMYQNYGMLSRSKSFVSMNQTDSIGLMNLGDGEWCNSKSLFVGDFNGDGRSDLLCSMWNGQNYVMLSHVTDYGVIFIPMSNDPEGLIKVGANDIWCLKDIQELLVGDFNNDGKADLLCHNNKQINEGYTYVMLSTGNGFKPMADSSDGYVKVGRFGDFCSVGGRLVIGNFDGINGDDLLCNDPSAGNMIMVPHNTSFVPINSDSLGTVNLGIMKACTDVWCTRAGSVLMSGHFNNDNRSDLICNEGGQNEIMLASFKNDSSCSFQAINPANGNRQLNGWIPMGKDKWPIWCDATKTKLIVADIDGDNLDDLVCNTAGAHEIQLCRSMGNDQYEFRSINAGNPSDSGRTKIANYDVWCNSQSIFTGHFSDSGLDDLWCNQNYNPVGALIDEN